MTNSAVRSRLRFPLVGFAVFAAILLTIAASPLRAASCVTDVYIQATDQGTAPSIGGWQLAGYWDVAGEGVGTGGGKGGWNMGVFYKLGDDPSQCLQSLCVKASESNDPGTPDGYTRVGMWDADAGGSWGVCGVNVPGAPRQASTGYYMMGLYKRQASPGGNKVIEGIQLTASDKGEKAFVPGYEAIANWDVDRGGGHGSDGSTGAFMMTLAVKFGSGPPAIPSTSPRNRNRTTTPSPGTPSPSTSGSDWNPTVTSRNVTLVALPDHKGGFVQINKTQWQEMTPSWEARFTFTELSRDDKSVYLEDSSRNLFLELNLQTKEVKCCGKNWGGNFKLYDITGTQAGFVQMVSHLRINPNLKYYRLQLRTSDKYNLRVWNTGRVGSDQDLDDYSQWLLIPTGDNIDEYWIFNKGAKGGRGQALARPAALTTLNQWDFLPDDKAQRFKLQATDSGYFRLIEQASLKAVSTRWNETAFVWGVTEKDQQQEFRLVEADSVKKTDTLAGYLFWNFDSDRIKSYFVDLGYITPDPSLLNIKRMVFFNASDRRVVPAVHHFGCADAPSRSGMPQCWFASLGPDEQATMEVTDYIKNAGQIWAIIGSLAAIAGGIAITVACVGLCAPAVAAALGPAAATAAGAIVSIQLGAQLALATFAVVDFAVLTWAIPQTISSTMDVAQHDERHVSGDEVNKLFKEMGVTEKTLPIIRTILGDNTFGARGAVFDGITDGFYIEETTKTQKLVKLFYSDGTCLFLIE